jgi:hypothetical protein
MASSGKKKTTMAKLTRESRLRERRVEKQARKLARKQASAHPVDESDADRTENHELEDATGIHEPDGSTEEMGEDSPASTAPGEGAPVR